MRAFSFGLFGSSCHFHRNYTCRNGYNAIPDDHQDACQKLAQGALRRDISIANGSNGDNRPVDRYGNAGKAAVLSFNDIHECADYGNQGDDAGQKYDDLVQACS